MYQTRTIGIAEDIEEMNTKQYDSVLRNALNIMNVTGDKIEEGMLMLADMLTDEKDKKRFIRLAAKFAERHGRTLEIPLDDD
ncbi:MAG: hypothetical protein LBM98_03225 [Oscillospiraceae bacterium]|jgi:hypothetical protein|nr:hypothetical protein [Oscillospiraceae bacterium]